METIEHSVEAVRCVACHTVYEHALSTPQNGENTACPECGEAAWLAIRVPVAKTAALSPA